MFTMKKSLFVLFFIFSFLFIPVVEVSANSPVTIKAEPQVRITAEKITLGDVAEIRGDEQSVEKIKSIYVARSPKPGMYVRLSRKSIIFKLKRAGFDTSTMNLILPPSIRVYPVDKKIEGEVFIKEALDYIKRNKIVPEEEITNLKPLRKPMTIYVPDGNIKFECLSGSSHNQSIINIYVDVLSNGRNITRKKIPFRRKIAYKAKSSDKVDSNGNPEKKDRSSGDSVNKEKSVRVGDLLEVSVVRKNIVVTVMGTARQSGSPGDSIKVRLKGSRKVLTARLTDKQHAYVEIP